MGDKIYKYAGIGSRNTPKPIQNIMEQFAVSVANNHILRTGGASGADHAFYRGVKDACSSYKWNIEDKLEMFLPWDGFNDFYADDSPAFNTNLSQASYVIAEQYHPTYKSLSKPQKKLMARNSLQILGRLLTSPVDFVVCYTEDGKASGGTGQALRIAKDRNIPIYNLYHKKSYDFCMKAIETHRKNHKNKN